MPRRPSAPSPRNSTAKKARPTSVAARPRSLTLHDVAALAGVSIATVSAVVNQKSSVGEKSRQRVEAALQQLDYRPHPLARSLKTGRSHAIGLVVPDITNPFFPEAMAGIEAVARSRGYSVLLANSNEDPAQERQNLHFLHSRRVDGIVLVCASGGVDYAPFTSSHCPIVFMDRLPAGKVSAPSVIVDNAGAARRATQHLLALGHERIAIIAGRLDLSVGSGRLAGFKQALRSARLPLRPEYLQLGDFQPDSGYRAGLHLMSLAEPPTAVFACNNSMTLGLMRALAERQIDCPERVSVLAFDDFPWAAHFRPELTTVAQPVLELGRQAMRLLLAAIDPASPEAAEIKGNQVILSAELRIRKSTAAPPVP